MSTRRNLLASAAGNTWTALVQVAFVPLYIVLLGVEAYGLIGFYAFLQTSLWILDLGFTPALSREVARARTGGAGAAPPASLLRSIEYVFAVIAIVVVAAAFAAAPWIADHWLHLEAMSASSATKAIEMMGALVALRLFIGLHRGAITGAQRLVWLNAAGAAFATLRGAGVVPVLWLAPTLEAFFLFQLAVTALEAGVMARQAWGLLPAGVPAEWSLAALRGIRRFSGGVVLVALLYTGLTQSDKLVLSTLLPLAAFGHYVLASSVAGALLLLSAPVGTVAYPRLSELAAHGTPHALAEAFHRFSQLVSLAVAPAGMVLALFSAPVLALWTREEAITSAAAPLLTLLASGTVLHAFTATPYLVPMVIGRLRILVTAYAALVVAFVPAIYLGATSYGAIAAAWIWLAINALGLVFALPLVASALGAPHAARWAWNDVILPAAAAFAVASAVRLAWPADAARGWVALAGIAVAYGASLLAAALALPLGRGILANAWSATWWRA